MGPVGPVARHGDLCRWEKVDGKGKVECFGEGRDRLGWNGSRKGG